MSCRTYISKLTDDKKAQEKLEALHNQVFKQLHDSKLFRQYQGYTFLPNADASGRYNKAKAFIDQVNKEHGFPVVGTAFTKATGREYAFVNVKNYLPQALNKPIQGELFGVYPRRLTFLRHGVTAEDIAGKNSGQNDVPINAEGKEESKKAGERLKEQGVDKLYTSPSPRAIQTAEATGISHEVVDDLAPWNLGDFSGKPEDEFDEAFYVNNSSIPVPGGESFDNVVMRTRRGIDRISEKGEDNAAILTHSKTLKLIEALEKNNGIYDNNTKKDYLKEHSPKNDQIADLYWHNPRQEYENSLPAEASAPSLEVFRDWAKKAGLTGRYTDGIVVQGKVNKDVVGLAHLAQNLYEVLSGYESRYEPEEIMHFAVQAIKETEPELYNDMIKAVGDYNIYQQTFKDYQKTYLNEDGSPNTELIKEEAITKVLADTIVRKLQGMEPPQRVEQVKSWWERIKDWFQGLIKKAGYNPFERASERILKGETFANEYARLYRNDIGMFGIESPVDDVSSPLQKAIDNIVETLTRTIGIYKNRGKTEQIESLETLLNQVRTANDIQAVADYINEAYNYTVQAAQRLQQVAGTTAFDAAIIDSLKIVYDYIQAYNVLDDIAKLPEYNQLGKEINETPNSVIQRLYWSINQRNLLKQEYFDQVIPRLGKLLFENRGPEIEGAWRKAFKTEFTQATVESELRAMSKDESVWRAFLDPLVSSPSPVLGLFGRMTAHMIDRAEKRSMEFDARKRDALKKFFQSTGRSGTNAAKMFEGLTEIRTTIRKIEDVDEKGQKLGTYTEKPFSEKYFVEETDWNAYNKKKRDFIKMLDEKLRDEKITKATYGESLSNWHKENSEKRPDADEIIAEKEATLPKAAFEAWRDRNNPLSFDGTHREYRHELSRPKKGKYLNKAYEKLLQNPGLKELYDFVVKEHLEAQRAHPEGKKLGMRVPSVLKSLQDVLIEDGMKAALLEAKRRGFNWTESDIERGIQNQEGEEVKYLPLHYSEHMSADMVSNDVIASLTKFAYMSYRYEEFEKNLGVAEALKDVMAINRPFKVNLSGEKIKDALAEKAGLDRWLKKEYGDSNAYAHLKNFIDMIYYGEMKAKGAMVKVFGKEISVDKTLDTMARLTAIDMLAGNLTQGFNLAALLSTMRISEGMGGRYYTAKDWGVAEGKFYSILHHVLGDVGKQTEQLSMWGQIIQRYDPIQGSFRHHTLGTVTGDKAKRLFASEPTFLIQHMASYQAQIKGMLAMMNHTEVEQTDKNGKTSKIKLIDAYETDSRGILKLKDGVKWTDDDVFNLKERMHSITRGLHGANDDLSKTTAHRFAILRLALLFRNWVVPGFRRRYDPRHPDFERDDVIEGNHRAFFRLLGEDIKNRRFDLLFNWKNMDEMDKQNVRRTMTEIGFLIATGIAVGMLAPSRGDDEKNKWAGNFTLYQAKRLQTELLFYTDPLDAWKILKSPTAAMTAVENTALLLDNALPWNISDRYQTGKHVGELKVMQRLKKVVPLINHLENLENPDEAFNWFKSVNF